MVPTGTELIPPRCPMRIGRWRDFSNMGWSQTNSLEVGHMIGILQKATAIESGDLFYAKYMIVKRRKLATDKMSP